MRRACCSAGSGKPHVAIAQPSIAPHQGVASSFTQSAAAPQARKYSMMRGLAAGPSTSWTPISRSISSSQAGRVMSILPSFFLVRPGRCRPCPLRGGAAALRRQSLNRVLNATPPRTSRSHPPRNRGIRSRPTRSANSGAQRMRRTRMSASWCSAPNSASGSQNRTR